MNTVHLEHFAAFVECGTRAAAAKRLYTSPQSISKSIYALEREFGIALVRKSGRNTVLTSAGYRFYEEVAAVLGHVEHLRRLAAVSQTSGPEKVAIAIATAPFDSSHVMEERIEAQNREGSPVELSFLFGPSGSCLSAVEEGIADCALVFGRVEKPGMACRRLFSFSPTVLMARTHPLAKRHALRLEDDTRDSLNDEAPLAQHHALRLDDMLPFPIAAPTDMRHCRRLIERRFEERTGRAISFCNVAHGGEKEFFLRENGLMFSTDVEMLDAIPTYLSTRCIAEEDSFSISCFYVEKKSADTALSAFVIPRLKRMARTREAQRR